MLMHQRTGRRAGEIAANLHSSLSSNTEQEHALAYQTSGEAGLRSALRQHIW